MTTFTDQSLMPFGQYKGEKMENVPARYLLWLRAEWAKEKGHGFLPVAEYIEENLTALCKECPDYIP